MGFSAVIVAAGSGSRAGPGTAKQWRSLGGRALVRWSTEAIIRAGAESVVVVIPQGEEDHAVEALAGLGGWRAAAGGATRADSVRAGLRALSASADQPVLVHDGARPFLAKRHIESLLAEIQPGRGAILSLPLSDTLKRADEADGGARTLDRAGLWRAQTPQAFRLGDLLEAYAAWPANQTPTDDAQVFERAGGRVTLVPGDPMLFKLTLPEDFAMAERLALTARSSRIGLGFDAHRFGAGESVWLNGVEIAHENGLIGHSDADAGLHALTDALLGAIGAGDIGDHFPPSDAKWRSAPSSLFVEHAMTLVAASGGRVVNADITLICEAPRIKPHREAMRARVAALLRVSPGAVSIKATTTEAMGFTGRREGLAAQAVVSVETPNSV